MLGIRVGIFELARSESDHRKFRAFLCEQARVAGNVPSYHRLIPFTKAVFSGNTNLAGTESGDTAAIHVDSLVSVRHNCVQKLNRYAGRGNVNAADPFVSPQSGNLRLKEGALCIDAGSLLVDFEPQIPGLQPPPPGDLDGKPRVVDGDGDGDEVIDMGAYEYQGN